MNIHISNELRERYPTYEFLGKPIKLRNGKNYMRAHHKVLERTLFYCFEDDFFYFERSDFDVFGGLTETTQVIS